MGILNITPDSFSDGGIFLACADAIAHALQMVEEGADIIDVGGESTRPGAQPVSAQQEMDRVLPVIEALHRQISIPISIDTSKPEVMRSAVAAGAGFINDVRALQEQDALQTAASLQVPVCLMHMQGEPRTMQAQPQYKNVVQDIAEYLQARLQAARTAGVDVAKLIVDPGFGFGKSLEHNLELLRGLKELKRLGAPILAGLSRKSMIGKALGLPVERRLHASVALALMAVHNGADIIRVHDVGPTAEALRMWAAVYPKN
ncbi:MAG: dihydropteroate synthase [Proteobacteria bacterium]|nr:dihydropteroate synthase [Pseudomonadota bacterium]